MMRDIPLATLTGVLLLAALLGAATAPATTPPPASRPTPRSMHDFHIPYYLDLAVEIQKLEPDARATRLRQIAADPAQAPALIPLCRMLFDARDNGTFRRPNIGGPSFIDGQGSGRDALAAWPLEPIALFEGIPIFVVRGYAIGGRGAESSAQYLEYCLANCKWRDLKFVPMAPADIQKKVEAFLAAHPKITPDGAASVRAQAQ